MSYGNNGNKNIFPIQNPIYNQQINGQQMNPNPQMINNNPQFGTRIINNNPMNFNQQMMQQQMMQQQFMQQQMMPQQMGNPGMMNQFIQNQPMPMNPQMPINQPMPMNPQMGNPMSGMNPTTSMQNAQEQAYKKYLTFCYIQGLDSSDSNIYSKYYHIFLEQNQNNNNNLKWNINQMGMTNGAFNGGNGMRVKVGNGMNNGVINNIGNKAGNDIYVDNMNQPITNVYTPHFKTGKLPEILPRPENYINNNNLNNNFIPNNIPTVNIVFQANTGLKINLAIPRNITIYQMLKLFTEKIGIQDFYINKGLTFLFNGQNMLPYFNHLVGDQFKDGMLITVFDQNGVIGA